MAMVIRCGSIQESARVDMLPGHEARTGRIKFDGAGSLSVLSAKIAIATVSLSLAVSASSGKARAAGAAYFVDTAEVGEPGACKVESWASAASNHDFFAATSPTCVVNMFRPVELSSQFSRARFDEEWTSVAVPKIKTNLVPTSIGSWGVAVSGSVVYDFTNT